MRKEKIVFQKQIKDKAHKNHFMTLFETFAEYYEMSAKALADYNLNQKSDEIIVRFRFRYFSKVREVQSNNFINTRLGRYKILSVPRQIDLRGTQFEVLAVRCNNNG